MPIIPAKELREAKARGSQILGESGQFSGTLSQSLEKAGDVDQWQNVPGFSPQ